MSDIFPASPPITGNVPVVEAPATVVSPSDGTGAPSLPTNPVAIIPVTPQPQASNVPYVVAVVVVTVIVMFAITLISIFRHEDNTLLIASVIGFATPTTLSLLAYMKSQETHLSVNSRLDSFITAAEVAAKASGLIQGNVQGRIEANKRNDEINIQKDGMTT